MEAAILEACQEAADVDTDDIFYEPHLAHVLMALGNVKNKRSYCVTGTGALLSWISSFGGNGLQMSVWECDWELGGSLSNQTYDTVATIYRIINGKKES